MRIIDKEKDFYDYIYSFNGVDNDIVYDRRLYRDLNYEYLDLHTPRLVNEDCEPFNDALLLNCKGKVFWRCDVLKCGYTYYLFIVYYTDIRSSNGKCYARLWDKVYDRDNKLFKGIATDAPLVTFTLNEGYYYSQDTYEAICNKFNIIERPFYKLNECEHISFPKDNSYFVYNPLLKYTYFRSFIDPKEIWDNIYEFLSSLKDKLIVDNRSDVEKLESHGFDKKISFRNVK